MVPFDDVTLAKIEATWKNDESMAKIESNWRAYERWCEQLGDRYTNVKQLLNDFGERACMAPASSRLEFHNAFPGGFIDHSLRVLKFAVEFTAALKVRIPKESLIISALFHDLGKIGTLEHEYYAKQDSDWHRKRGQMYIKNPKITLSNAQLGLFLLGQYGVKLSEMEYEAILLNDGPAAEANKEYAMKEGKLSLIVHWADRWSTQCEKDRQSLLDHDNPRF